MPSVRFFRQLDSVHSQDRVVRVSADGIQKSEPAPDAREAIPEAGEGFDGTKKEILETMKMYDLCGFDEDEE